MNTKEGTDEVHYVEPQELKRWLHDGQEIAVLDIREYGQYGEQHLLYAVNLPYSSLEIDAFRLVPNFSARIVLIDENADQIAHLSSKRLKSIGYKNVYILSGGIQNWIKEGLSVFAGVNVPSKVFGEIAEEVFHTPHISAQDLQQKQENGDNLLVLDGRPFSEYQKMNIPGSICCPNGELSLYIDDLVPDEETTIVINCAGRTRSIIGAQTLLNLGIKNPIYALENGTQGWMLADQKLEHGSTRSWQSVDISTDSKQKQKRAKNLLEKYQIQSVDMNEVKEWLAQDAFSTFLLDVRDPTEHANASYAGFENAPGGQLIQATDHYVGVRKSRLVLLDTDGVRAPVVGSWLWMLGWDVYLLTPPKDWCGFTEREVKQLSQENILKPVAAKTVQDMVKKGVAVLDLRSSGEYRKSHLEGAIWSIRPNIKHDLLTLGEPKQALVIGNDLRTLELAALDMKENGVEEIVAYVDSLTLLAQEGLTLLATPELPVREDRIDYLYFVHDRHDGNKEAARQYLSWELGLVAQLDDEEKKTYRISG